MAFEFDLEWHLPYAGARARRVTSEIRVIRGKMTATLVGKSTSKSTPHTGKSLSSRGVVRAKDEQSTQWTDGILRSF